MARLSVEFGVPEVVFVATRTLGVSLMSFPASYLVFTGRPLVAARAGGPY
jgi:hypothetical protein